MLQFFNKKKPQKTTTQVIFQNTSCDTSRRLDTNNGADHAISSWEEVEDALYEMFSDPDEFVILTVGDPCWNIRFIQAAQIKTGGITLELGLESPDGTRLVERTCSQKECLAIFREFYSTANVPQREAYQPVEFFT